jgi:plastocyanin
MIWLPDDASWKPADPTVIEQRDQTFIPVLAVAPPGGVVQFHNSDPQPHNVFALDPRAGIDCDLGLGDPGSTLTLTVAWPAGTVVKHGCKIHPQMQLWIASLSSAFHAVAVVPTDPARVTLHLADIPATATRLSFWAPRCTPLTVPLNPALIQPILRKNKPCGTLHLIRLP